MVKTKIRIGTRGSQLALWQASYIEDLLKQNADNIELERVIIKTEGDRDQNSSLTQIGGVGVFTKAIEDALLEDRIDIAVHSLKDLPSGDRDGLVLTATPQRGPVEDALVTPDGIAFDDLAQGAKIASGSIRRRSQLLRLRPDLHMTDLRGNIDTRLNKLKTQNLDAIIMARAALERLNITQAKYYIFPMETLIPSVGQGAIGIQTRHEDNDLNAIVAKINHIPTYQAITAERAFLHRLDSGCQFPVGAIATITKGQCEVRGFVGSEDGTKGLFDQITGPAEQANELGRRLADTFIAEGARDILKNVNMNDAH